MRTVLAGLLLTTFCIPALAQEWLAVHGDPSQREDDLIEIRPASLSRAERLTVEVRVSRSMLRDAYGGGKYRSHQGLAVVDCDKQAAWYVQMQFYGQPLWGGPVTMSRTFKAGDAPVAFKDIPGQAERLVRAACKLAR